MRDTQGRIIKGIAGFYYVHVVGFGIYECRAKGVFRKDGIKPLVGDRVIIEVLDEDEKVGNIIEVLSRKNELVRPAVANVDQALIVFAVARPSPQLYLLDRFLVTMESKGVPSILCFNKEDLADGGQVERLSGIYKVSGYSCIFASVRKSRGIDRIRELLQGKTTVIAGPSGVGKSSLINLLWPKAQMETGDISRKIERGKHTTRHSELFPMDGDSYIMDTPGFSSLYVDDFEKEELKHYFSEFRVYEGCCRFHGCSHVHEPGCAVKDAVGSGAISKERYGSYCEMYQEIKDKRRY